MKISFDFDNTLSRPLVQNFAKGLIKKHNIWIVTSRISDKPMSPYGRIYDNSDLYIVAKNVGIPDNKIIFTNGNDKYKILDKNNFEVHFDDDKYEHDLIQNYTNIKSIQVQSPLWLEKAKKIIK